MVEWKKFLLKSKSRRQCDSTSTSFDVCDSLHTVTGLPSRTATSQAEPSLPQNPPEVLARNREELPQNPQDLARNHELLPDDVSNYYYPDLDMDSAKRLLQEKPSGTFLLRQSQCPSAMYTLSVKSEKHVFNVRIFKRLQADGGYHLDAPKHLRKCFSSISELLRHYSNSPKELIALCSAEGIDERTTFRLMYPLSKSESTLNLAAPAAAAAGDGEERPASRPVTRQTGGSLKAMVKWL